MLGGSVEPVSQSGARGMVPAAQLASDPLPAVKLIIWDLDDTFWTGTLSEGQVAVDDSRIDLIRALTRRGIINSICSKNEESEARSRLEQLGIWSEFVFARIDWSPKGARVAQIIKDAQLRPPDVLFIDDSPLNREEVRHFAPGIQTGGPDIIDHLLSMAERTGKDDRDLSRLRQYQMLERKLDDRRSVPESNEEFLRSCDIRVGLSHDTGTDAKRILELVNRTNQLNFTKRQLGADDLETLLASPDYETGSVRVRDRYGDYGVCGFYSVSLTDGVLTDFLFSCRVLHMGVEQWLYDRLGRPPLSIVGETASTLDVSVDWITLDANLSGNDQTTAAPLARQSSVDSLQRSRVLMVGGCDLEVAAEFLGGNIATDLSRPGPTGILVHVEHSEIIKQSSAPLTADQRRLVDRIPFLDQEAFRSPVLISPDYDVLVYSVLMDYTQGLYRHRQLGLVVPWTQFDQDATNPDHWPSLQEKFGRGGVDTGFLRWFSQEFEFLGALTAEQFQHNIGWLAQSIPTEARLICVNGVELPFDHPEEPARHVRHREMNAALDAAVAQLPNVAVCDVRTFILSRDDLTSDIRHYRRRVYLRMAEEIRTVASPDLKIKGGSQTGLALFKLRFAIGRHKGRLLKALKRPAHSSSSPST